MKQRFLVGQNFREKFKVDTSMIEHFADISGDRNPIHLDAEEAKAYGYPRQVAHGAILVALLSRMIGMQIPGPGAVWMSQTVEWILPVFVGDEIELVITTEEVSTGTGILCLGIVATNQKKEIVMRGNAKVKVAEKLTGGNPGVAGMRRVAVVTGGSRGIGAAIARRLGASGMAVAITYRESQSSAGDVVQEIRSAGGLAEAFPTDVGDQVATSAMIHDIIRCFGRLDVVVHGASPGIRRANIGELCYGYLEPYLKVYLGGALAIVASASPGMAEQKFGRFIFLGTAAMLSTPPVGWAAYLAAKQALWGLVKSIATELGPLGITANMVSPGMTVTDLTADIPARVKELEARKSPMRRLATAQDTAELVAFLVSDGAGYINGMNLPVAGGPL